MSVEIRFAAPVVEGAPDAARFERAARVVFGCAGCDPDDELSIVLVSDDEIRRLNRVYRSRDLPTDVLSFALDDGTAERGGAAVGGTAEGGGAAVGGTAEGGGAMVAAAMTKPGRRPASAKGKRAGVLLGDVVISVETAGRQARRGGWSLEEELNRLLIHGLLHVLGFDHEQGEAEQARMKAEEARLAAALGAAGFGCASEETE